MNEFIITTHQLTKKFGNHKAVNRINLKVAKGGIYGFLGPNGAGKSTTIRMLLGLVKPTDGDVFIFGKSIKKHRLEILKQVGSMVEAPSYYGHLTGYENLEIIRILKQGEKDDIERVLEIVGLKEAKNKKVREYSMGMKQRLGIAQALLGKPKLLILDEPTNGLDPKGIHEIRELIKSLPGNMGITIFLSSHILKEIELMANHVGIITKGKLVFQGTLDELKLNNPTQIILKAQPKAEVLKFLKSKGYELELFSNSIAVKTTTNTSQINKELVYAGFDVFHISREQGSLEDIFLRVTSGG